MTMNDNLKDIKAVGDGEELLWHAIDEVLAEKFTVYELRIPEGINSLALHHESRNMLFCMRLGAGKCHIESDAKKCDTHVFFSDSDSTNLDIKWSEDNKSCLVDKDIILRSVFLDTKEDFLLAEMSLIEDELLYVEKLHSDDCNRLNDLMNKIEEITRAYELSQRQLTEMMTSLENSRKRNIIKRLLRR